MLQHRFLDSARQSPNKVAFIDRTTGRDITFKQARIAGLILARRFSKLERGRIGIMLPTSGGGALAVLGSVMAGLTPVMINYSTGAKKNCRYAQHQCDFHIIITTRGLLEKTGCPQLPEMLFIEDILATLKPFEKALAFAKTQLPDVLLKRLVGRVDLEQPAVILFTSGSEKDPKVVQLTQRNILSNIDSFCTHMEIYGMDRLLAVLPYFHVFGLTINLWTPLCLGMTSITYANPLEFKTVAQIIRETKPELLVGTPVFLEGYVRQSAAGDFSSIKLAVSGADKCPDSLRQLFREKHGLEIHEGYGATETSPVISANPRDDNRPGSIGRVIPGTEVKILNYETGEECAPGETGKILVRGAGVMNGYLNDVEESSLKLKSGWYDTGDLGYMDADGFLYHKGRLKRFVKIGGEMVSLVAVEECLNEVTDMDCECCVVELPDAKRGSKIVAVTSKEVDSSKTNKRLADELPNIALPRKYVTVSSFPRMGSGKTDFRGLTDYVWKLEQEDD